MAMQEKSDTRLSLQNLIRCFATAASAVVGKPMLTSNQLSGECKLDWTTIEKVLSLIYWKNKMLPYPFQSSSKQPINVIKYLSNLSQKPERPWGLVLQI